MTAPGSQDEPVAAEFFREILYSVSTSKQPLRLAGDFAEWESGHSQTLMVRRFQRFMELLDERA